MGNIKPEDLMDLRVATLDDLDFVVDMAMKFVNTTKYVDYSEEETIRKLAQEMIASNGMDKIVLIHSDKGMIAGVVTPFIFGSKKVATEVAWWVGPEHRKSKVGSELLDAFEFWAKNIAMCSLVTMISLDDEVGKYYEKRGYELRERGYMKEL